MGLAATGRGFKHPTGYLGNRDWRPGLWAMPLASRGTSLKRFGGDAGALLRYGPFQPVG